MKKKKHRYHFRYHIKPIEQCVSNKKSDARGRTGIKPNVGKIVVKPLDPNL